MLHDIKKISNTVAMSFLIKADTILLCKIMDIPLNMNYTNSNEYAPTLFDHIYGMYYKQKVKARAELSIGYYSKDLDNIQMVTICLHKENEMYYKNENSIREDIKGESRTSSLLLILNQYLTIHDYTHTIYPLSLTP